MHCGLQESPKCSKQAPQIMETQQEAYHHLCHIGKGLPQQAEVAQGVPGRLRPWIFLTFGTTRVVGHHSYAPAAFTLGEIPGTYF
jgi:hypothetical protein